MAKVDFPPDPSGFFPGPASSSVNPHIRPPVEKKGFGRSSRAGKTGFSSLLEKTGAADLGPPEDLPVSEETLNRLLEEVRGAGDVLRDRPFPQEILAYKKTVRNFMRYVVDNGYRVEEHPGIPKYLKPSFKGRRGSPDSQDRRDYYRIQVVDQRLEELAAMLMKGQLAQLELLSRLEEIRGLLVDLIS
jgi:uncharacterized protein YaaR (DUF327 family)